MEVIKSVKEMQEKSLQLRIEGKKIAFVPTMGYFHEGHVSLMKRARELADVVVTSLFVNPTQFAPGEDFNTYPRDFSRDSKMAEDAGVNFLFNPETADMYPMGYNSEIQISGISSVFEGTYRPSHFNGVATVVAKLFNAVDPDYAVFGQKDYQQTMVVHQLVRDLNFRVKIDIAPTFREKDGLAMSSRNTYLSKEERQNAIILYYALGEAKKAIEQGEKSRKIINAIMHKTLRTVQDIKIDYASSADAMNLAEPEEFYPGQKVVLLIAAYLGKTRLIDNALITIPE